MLQKNIKNFEKSVYNRQNMCYNKSANGGAASFEVEYPELRDSTRKDTLNIGWVGLYENYDLRKANDRARKSQGGS